MEYGENMKYVRQMAELNQKQVAEILGIARSTYNQYEQQYNIIPLKTLNAFCNYFNVSIDYILGLSKTEKYPNSKSDIDMELASKRLRLIRKENRLTQKDLANKLNIANSILCEYEKGHFLISTATLYSICKIFNVSADYILTKTDNKILTKRKALIK